MKYYLKPHAYSDVYRVVRRLISQLSFNYLFESRDKGIISCYHDGQTLKLMDLKLSETSDGVSIYILTSELSNSKGNLTADPEHEKNFIKKLKKELKTEKKEKEFAITSYDYLMAV